MNEDCYKEFPKRPEEDDGHKFSVCDCGHYWHNHDRNFLKAIFLFTVTLGRYGGGCDDCSCNTYHFMGKYTYEAKNALRACTDDN